MPISSTSTWLLAPACCVYRLEGLPFYIGDVGGFAESRLPGCCMLRASFLLLDSSAVIDTYVVGFVVEGGLRV